MTSENMPDTKSAEWHFGDRAFKWLTLAMALVIFLLIILIGWELARGSRLALHQFGWHFLISSDWDPVNETIRRAAVHFRHAGFLGHRAPHRRAHQHRHRRLSHRTRPALAAPAADHVHRTARRRAQRHSRFVGNFCDGAMAARPLVSVAAEMLRLSAVFSKARFMASACWPAASLLPS